MLRRMKRTYKKIFFFFVLTVSLASFFKFIMNDDTKTQKIDYPRFIQEIKKGNIQDITLQGKSTIKGSFKQKNKDGQKIYFKTIGDTGDFTLKYLVRYGVIPNYTEEKRPVLNSIIINLIPLILILFIMYRILKMITPQIQRNLNDDFIFNDMGTDDNDLFKDPVGRHNRFYIYDIWLTSSEGRWVRKAIRKIKKKEQLKSRRSGEYIVFLCKRFIDEK